ncbi:hypothetical protein BDV36DRAFT_121969 [Aspergillus pseudocaelatus]|uniref:Xylanolytic transcriptional activator regulatory domain-containing protein n=1 Tax=Aspergillus pseudocaelatus TaxID=1825620 RepID=A0ABQ6WSD5_9EURO|nr:hypothetical protein BDV36DRAFT_121969 [Aspergillus pseudocaelatus]
MKSTYVPVPENDNNLWVILLVLGMGAHYSSLAIMQPREKVAVQQLSKDLIQRIDQRFLRIIDSADEEAVQVCVLLGSFYLFNGRPTAGLGILGSGIKIAQVLRLHREDAIMGISAARLESHRRSWWALEVFDKYAAIAFGRPCSIDDSDCNVGTVTHIRADMQEQPRQAAQLEYHQWKFRLYRIMGPFLGRRLQTNRIASIKSIHAQLVSWQNQLPQYLRLEEYKDKGILKGPSLLQMQALCLQLTYDNIQIILHRSLAFRAGSQLSSADRSPTDLPSSALSREQLFQSAVRTSDLYDYRRILQACRKTHATMHVGICLFTAGVVLCAFAISEPLSARSQTAKRGVMNILRFQRDHILDGHLLSAQSVKILEGLVAVVMRSEQGFIRGDKISPLTASSTPTEEGLQQTIGEVAGARTFSGPRIGQLGYSHMGNLVEESSDHVQEPLLSVPEGTGDEYIDTRGLSDRPELEWLSMDSAAGVMWTGGNPYFTDPGFADASQLWLWSDKPDVQPFLS